MDEVIYQTVAVIETISQSSVKIVSVDGQSFVLKRLLFPEDIRLQEFVEYSLFKRPSGETYTRVTLLNPKISISPRRNFLALEVKSRSSFNMNSVPFGYVFFNKITGRIRVCTSLKFFDVKRPYV